MRKVVRVGFLNSYRGTINDVVILRVTGEKGASFFKQSFELRIEGDLIPEAAAEEIIGELQVLFARHDAGAAFSAKAVFKPTKEFHTARHTMHSAAENMEIDKVGSGGGEREDEVWEGRNGRRLTAQSQCGYSTLRKKVGTSSANAVGCIPRSGK